MTTRLVHTYSIVAHDPETGQLGVAVQSHWFSTGSIVTWAEAGVGAVATQSLVDPSYGPLGLELLRMGRSPEEALKGLLAADSGFEVRQVGMVDVQGRVAVHTGARCIPEAGHHVGKGYTTQANLMERNTVPDAMARAYEGATGPFAERLIAALEAAQREKGDIRGQQSAAILIVAAKATGRPWEDRLMDLRVEDNPNPLKELKRLVQVHQAYQHMNAGDVAMEHQDVEAAKREYGRAEALIPENEEMVYWHAVALANAGSVDDSLPLFRKVFHKNRNWAVLTPRLVPIKLLNVSDADLARITKQAR
ncbi:MAG TPA: DUF1028 domain-containing protein [Candidatus Eisenbacteria bacterium]|nr:DUF1028 domain-containing protein [Candidatus Eisenbacteria bacterium]